MERERERESARDGVLIAIVGIEKQQMIRVAGTLAKIVVNCHSVVFSVCCHNLSNMRAAP